MHPEKVEVYKTLEELSLRVIQRLIGISRNAIRERGRFLVVLSGGSTPRQLFKLLSQGTFADQVAWNKVHVFWADERCVPPDAPESNYFQAHETLLKHVPLPEDNIHRIQGEMEPAEAALAYAKTLNFFGRKKDWPRFDLVLLGMGEDGHTASLFPGSDPDMETDTPTLAVTANYQGRPAQRVTLTPAVFNDARHIFFLVSGENKARVLQRVINGPPDLRELPAQRIQPSPGSITWLVDKPAASHLTKNNHKQPDLDAKKGMEQSNDN